MSPNEIDVQELFARVDYHLKVAINRRYVSFREADDLKQDLILAAFVKCEYFDPSKSAWSTFLNNVLEREVRQFRLRKRWRKNQVFENIEDVEEEDHPLTNLYPTYELNDAERHVFFSEIMTEVERLPERMKKICLLLCLHTKARTAELLRMKDTNLSKQLHKIRELFDESPIIRDYFENF